MAKGAREALIRVGVDRGFLRSSLNGAERQIQGFGSKATTSLKRAFTGGISRLDIAGFIGISTLADAAKQVLEFETRIMRLGINARKPAGEMAVLKKQIFEISQARGVNSSELLGGMEKFVAATGDIKSATDAMDTFAMVASATGTPVEDIAITAAALSTNFKVAGHEMKTAFGGLLAQGKSGAVELKDMATITAGLTPQFRDFGDTGLDGLNRMGAALQVARSGFSSASETATGFASMMKAIVVKAKPLKEALGIDVFRIGPDGVQELRSFDEIMGEIVDRSKGDPEILQDVIGDKEGMAFFRTFLGDGMSRYRDFLKVSHDGAKQLTDDFADVSKSPGFMLTQAQEQIKSVFNEQLVRLLPVLADSMKKIADAIAFMAAHSSEIIAMFLAMKAGGMMTGMAAGGAAGVAGRLAGGGGKGRGGRGASLMAAAGQAGYAARGGPPRRGLGSRLMGGGGALLGAAGTGGMMGLAVGGALGLDDTDSAMLGVVHAAAMLPGPLGAVAMGLAGLGDAALLLVNRMTAKLNKVEAETATNVIGSHAMEAARDLGYSVVTKGDRSQKEHFGIALPGEAERAALERGEVSDKASAGAAQIMNEGKAQGFVKQDGDRLTMDMNKLDAFLGTQKKTDEEKAVYRAAAIEAHRVATSDPATRAAITGVGTSPYQKKLEPQSYQEKGIFERFGITGATTAPGPTPRDVRIRIVPLEGYSVFVDQDKSNRNHNK